MLVYILQRKITVDVGNHSMSRPGDHYIGAGNRYTGFIQDRSLNRYLRLRCHRHGNHRFIPFLSRRNRHRIQGIQSRSHAKCRPCSHILF